MAVGAVAATAAALTTCVLPLVALIAAVGGGVSTAGVGPPTGVDGVSALAMSEIPPQYLRLYQGAAERYGLDWAILAAIGKVECDHGRDPDPSCTHEGAVNAAGAGGPMQFLSSTWRVYGVDVEGVGGPDRWKPPDAIYTAANYLRASGAPNDYARAIFTYNHADWYVAEVKSWAARYRGASSPWSEGDTAGNTQASTGQSGREESEPVEGADTVLATETTTAVRFIAGAQAAFAPGDGHLAFLPAGAPAAVQAMVVAGNELQDLPYGPGGHPDPRGARDEDCSSTVNYVLYRAGVRPIAEIVEDNPLAQDYVSWGSPGPGRWVTIYATDSPTPHVFIVIAGLRLDTSHDGTDEGPNRAQDGPRWRVFDRIPTWAHWSVRHPPGL